MIERTLTLADGRQLSYSDLGPSDAPVIMYCHGHPGSHVEPLLLQDLLASRGIRVRTVALDRPGFGLSTFQPSRSFLDWPADVTQAADQLGLGRFAVLGLSGGAPYALACGFALGDRVSRLAIAVGLAPPCATGMDDAPVLSQLSANRLIRRLQIEAMAFAINHNQEDRVFNQMMDVVSDPDREMLHQPHIRRWFLDTLRIAFRQGGRGAAHEVNLYRKPWGIDVVDIETPTMLWYGAVDTMVPASAGKWFADRLPRAEYTLWPDHGHFSWTEDDGAIAVVTSLLDR